MKTIFFFNFQFSVLNSSRVKKVVFFMLISSFLFLYSCHQPAKMLPADAYSDSIMTIQNRMVVQVDSFLQSLYCRHYDTELFYNRALEEHASGWKTLQDFGHYKNNSILQDAGNQFYLLVDSMLNREGRRLVEISRALEKSPNLYLHQERDSLSRHTVKAIVDQQIFFDSVLTRFLNQHGHHVKIDTCSISTRAERIGKKRE